MKTELNFLELHHLVKELQILIGTRIDNVYEPDGFLLQIHKPGTGKLYLRIKGTMLWLTQTKPLNPEKISGMCSLLRNHLEGKKITKIEQEGSERIVKITLETQKDKYTLYLELFAKGNIILTDSEQKILGATEERAWKDRQIKRGVTYSPPPPKKNLFELTPQDITKDEKQLAGLGLGKTLAKEILTRGADHDAYKEILKEKIDPRAYNDGELSTIKLKQYTEEGQKCKTISELIDTKLSSTIESQRIERIRQAYEQKKQKLKEIIDIQTKTIDKQEKYETENQRKAELIYEHYQELKEILDTLNKAKTKYSLQEMRTKLNGHPKIKDLIPKTSEVIIEIQ